MSFQRLGHTYVKTCRSLLMIVWESGVDHLTA